MCNDYPECIAFELQYSPTAGTLFFSSASALEAISAPKQFKKMTKNKRQDDDYYYYYYTFAIDRGPVCKVSALMCLF